MSIYTLWPGTPVRDFIYNNVPGAKQVASVMKNAPIFPYGNISGVQSPTWGQANNYLQGAKTGYAQTTAPVATTMYDQPAGPAYTPPTSSPPAVQITQPPPSQDGNLGALVDVMMSRGYNDRAQAEAVAKANFGSLWNEYMGGSSGGDNGYYDQARNQITSGYDNYFAQLDQMLNSGLPSQRTAQEQVVYGQYNSGKDQLDYQKNEGMNLLGNQRQEVATNQSKNLKNLAANLRNQYMAGNVYLGARGAGDSSAVNQYSYALTKLGNQQRGDIMSQSAQSIGEIQQREYNLKNLYDTEIKKLSDDRDAKIASIASWFADAQNNLQLQKAQGYVSQGKDLASLSQTLLSQALNFLSQADADARNQRSMLDQWAMNNAKTIDQLKQNMSSIQQYKAVLPQAQRIGGNIVTDAYGGMQMPGFGYGTSTDDKKQNSFNYYG